MTVGRQTVTSCLRMYWVYAMDVSTSTELMGLCDGCLNYHKTIGSMRRMSQLSQNYWVYATDVSTNTELLGLFDGCLN